MAEGLRLSALSVEPGFGEDEVADSGRFCRLSGSAGKAVGARWGSVERPARRTEGEAVGWERGLFMVLGVGSVTVGTTA